MSHCVQTQASGLRRSGAQTAGPAGSCTMCRCAPRVAGKRKRSAMGVLSFRLHASWRPRRCNQNHRSCVSSPFFDPQSSCPALFFCWTPVRRLEPNQTVDLPQLPLSLPPGSYRLFVCPRLSVVVRRTLSESCMWLVANLRCIAKLNTPAQRLLTCYDRCSMIAPSISICSTRITTGKSGQQ